MSKTRGRIIHSKALIEEFNARELSRRSFIQRAAAASAGGAVLGALPGCTPCDESRGYVCSNDADDDDDDGPGAPASLVGMGGGDGYKSALMAAMDETVARDGLAQVVNSGDTVFLKTNSNSGDYYPYSTRPRMIEELAQWCWDQGAGRVIVGDRSFWGDPNTYSNLVANGAVGAAENAGAELLVLDEGDPDLDWVAFPQGDAADWNGGFRYPLPVVEADVIINMPIVKTHFISTFTMGMKNLIGLVNAEDRERPGNLDTHVTAGNKLYKQIAQLNQHITPTITVLDGWEAVVQGGPTIGSPPGGLTASPGVMIVSTDRIAADVAGLAVLKRFAVPAEDIHNWSVWDNPQIVEAIEAGVGISGPDEFDATGPTVDDLDEYLAHIL
ncbi:MAG: DUF362 domain-containing protein [Myxococcota bacterium]|nr:DUF362 domain-containing protein [Myxococcota bacterium]